LQGAIRRARAGVALSLPLHPSRRHLEPSRSWQPTTARLRSDGKIIASKVPTAGRRCGFHPHEVHQTLPDPRAAQGLPPHPPLRALCQHRTAPGISQQPAHSSMSPRLPPTRNSRPDIATDTSTHAPLPLPTPVAAPHDRYRDLRARLRAEVAPDAEQDRHIMSQTSMSVANSPVLMRWPYAGQRHLSPNRRWSTHRALVD